MTLTPIKANMTELQLEGGLTVLFSYKTPVACRWTNGKEANYYYKTSRYWSNTTSRHINKWIGETTMLRGEKPQEYFDNLIAGVK